MTKKVLVLGGGYGGLQAALETRRNLTPDEATITLIDRNPYHQLITDLHLSAAGTVPVQKIQLSLKKLMANKQVHFISDAVVAIHPVEKQVELPEGRRVSYDILVIGLGSEMEFFGITGLEKYSYILKSVDDAIHIHEHIEECFVQYQQTQDLTYLTFVIGGAGLTGIELIGELADRLPLLAKKYPVEANKIRLLSIEASSSILQGFSETLIQRAKESLQSRGVEFITDMSIVKMEPEVVVLKNGDVVHTHTLVWTGGVRGNSVVAHSGLAVDHRGRAQVNEFLQSITHPSIFVVGDSALVIDSGSGRPYPPTAQLAGKMGVHVGRQISSILRNENLVAFRPHLSGTLASLGQKDAIGMIGQHQINVKGKPAVWLKTGSKVRWLSDIGGLFSRVR
ncbi:NAD(P)/FAD-dependent oxidoreductase [Alicyclobacillaceae bacterium I2511]|nr:NAD(P)/FAD-dependent oxidoreductase [Alicyclobacillaceae bacterium I2511]